jgi:hypothetical protein
MPAYVGVFSSVSKKGSQARAELPENGHFLPVPTKLLGVLGEKRLKRAQKGGPKWPILGILGLGEAGGDLGKRLEKGVSYRGTCVNDQSFSKLTGKRA